MSESLDDDGDDDDYMSDAILAQCEAKAGPKTSLVSQETKRRYEADKKHRELNIKNKLKPKAVIEADKRDEGLQKAIGSDNKGFALLQKMGYKPGMVIGKQGTGRSEPVPIEVKAGRSGIGHDTDVKRKRSAREAIAEYRAKKRQIMHTKMSEDFRSQLVNRRKEDEMAKDLYSSQKVCEQLDSQQGMTTPEEAFYWPDRLLPTNEDEEEEEEEELEEEYTTEEKLEILTSYLRTTHLYCVWCGITFSDNKDIQTNCPGSTRDDHD